MSARSAVTAAVLACALPAALLAGAPAQGLATTDQPTPGAVRAPADHAVGPIPKIRWTPCLGEPGIRCAEVPVPLDYARPRGRRITLEVKMKKASNPARRIGILLVNPGGPGEKAADRVADFAKLVGPGVASRFDIIGMDPRGVHLSAPLFCYAAKGVTLPSENRPFPSTLTQARRIIADDDARRAACAHKTVPTARHMSTADVARDMDLVRQAMGERQLSYVGMSYGSYLGQVYSQMFPRRVRAIVVDGVLDPVAWAGTGRTGRTVPQGARIQAGAGSNSALRAAFTRCRAAGARCPGGPRIAAEWDAVLASLRKKSFRFAGQWVTYQSFTEAASHDLYADDTIANTLASAHQLYLAMVKGKVIRPAQLRRTLVLINTKAAKAAPTLAWRTGSGTTPDIEDSINPQLEAVACADSINPSDPLAWWRASQANNKATRGFGPMWTWNVSLCPGYVGSGHDAYLGPFTRRPSTPLLMLNTKFDNATPLSGAKAAHRLSRGSRLVTVDAFGHLVAGRSRCAATIRTRYLLTRRLPSADVICTDVRPLFR